MVVLRVVEAWHLVTLKDDGAGVGETELWKERKKKQVISVSVLGTRGSG